MEEVGLKDAFDNAFFSSELGHTKSEPIFFEKVLQDLKIEPQDVSYWDDDPKNVDVANQVGIQSHVYKEFDEFKKEVFG